MNHKKKNATLENNCIWNLDTFENRQNELKISSKTQSNSGKYKNDCVVEIKAQNHQSSSEDEDKKDQKKTKKNKKKIQQVVNLINLAEKQKKKKQKSKKGMSFSDSSSDSDFEFDMFNSTEKGENFIIGKEMKWICSKIPRIELIWINWIKIELIEPIWIS